MNTSLDLGSATAPVRRSGPLDTGLGNEPSRPGRFAALGLGVLLLAVAGQAARLVDPVNKDGQVALRGYDAVAYFRQQAPVMGSPRFVHQWMGAAWQFSSERNRDTFAADPEQYAPQFGGYCAWAVSQGYTATIDPEAWKIVDGKLYLNYSKKVQKMWEVDVKQRIADGEKNWPRLHK